MTKWSELVGKRMLLTDELTRIQRNEWTLLEVTPNGKFGKFRNEIGQCMFWADFRDLVLLDVLP